MMIATMRRALAGSLGLAFVGTAAAQTACFPVAEPIPGWGVTLQRSVVVHDPAVFARPGAERDFSLGATLGAILGSAGVADTPAHRIPQLYGLFRCISITIFLNN